jgi:multidrug efflux system membrane fusion protein
MRFPFRSCLGGLTLIATCTAAGCSASGETPDRASGGRDRNSSPAIPVATAKVEEKSMPLVVSVIGSVEAYSNVAVHPQITGQLTSVEFKEGDDIKKGEIIFTLDFRPLETAFDQAEATLARDTAQAVNARASAGRYQDLQGRGIATSEQADLSRTSAEALDATVQADRAAVENAKVQLQYATIMAPISGRTGALMVHEGNLVRVNDTTPLVVINQVSPIYVSFGVPEGELPDLKRYLAQGSVAVEAAAPGETTPSRGHITFIDNAVDPTTGQIRVKASFPNDDRRLWPGQFVNVTMTLKVEQNAIVVPTAAVPNGLQGSYVYVVKPDGTVELRNITVEREAAQSTIVANGLVQGDIIVTDGQLRLAAGSKVSIKSGPGGTDSHSARATQ